MKDIRFVPKKKPQERPKVNVEMRIPTPQESFLPPLQKKSLVHQIKKAADTLPQQEASSSKGSPHPIKIDGRKVSRLMVKLILFILVIVAWVIGYSLFIKDPAPLVPTF